MCPLPYKASLPQFGSLADLAADFQVWFRSTTVKSRGWWTNRRRHRVKLIDTMIEEVQTLLVLFSHKFETCRFQRGARKTKTCRRMKGLRHTSQTEASQMFFVAFARTHFIKILFCPSLLVKAGPDPYFGRSRVTVCHQDNPTSVHSKVDFKLSLQNWIFLHF